MEETGEVGQFEGGSEGGWGEAEGDDGARKDNNREGGGKEGREGGGEREGEGVGIRDDAFWRIGSDKGRRKMKFLNHLRQNSTWRFPTSSSSSTSFSSSSSSTATYEGRSSVWNRLASEWISFVLKTNQTETWAGEVSDGEAVEDSLMAGEKTRMNE